MAKTKKIAAREDKYFLSISDVHHGAKPHQDMRNEFYAEGGFFDVLNELLPEESFIGVAVEGDWFDRKLDGNDPRMKLAASVMLDLFGRCMAYGKQLIVLRGTYGHDLDQLALFQELESIYEGFKLASRVCVTDFGGFKTLLIPEEYPEDAEEYYSEFFADTYDLVLAHGFTDQNCFDANEAERSVPKMPIFEAETLLGLAPLIIFGHDHRHRSFFGRIWYNGSFSRLCHGEEHPKGFLLVKHNGTEEFEIQHIENELAPRYITLVLDDLVKKTKDLDLSKAIQLIEKAREKTQADDLKIKITREFTRDNRTLVELIKDHYSSKEGTRIEAGKTAIERSGENTVEEEAVEDDETERDTRFDFLFEPGDMIDKIVKFIGIKYEGERDLNREMVTSLLATPAKA
jgi:hypothetical protein